MNTILRGRGIDGRETRVANDGYVVGYKGSTTASAPSPSKPKVASTTASTPTKTTSTTKSTASPGSPYPQPKSAASPSIFDKLTDPKLYTGAHKNRFDESGK